MDLYFVAARVLVAAGAPGYGPRGGGEGGSSDQHDRLKAINDVMTSWPSRLLATCLFVALAGLMYVLFRRAASPARKPLRAAIIALGLFAVLPLLTNNVMVAYVMFMCLAIAGVCALFLYALPRYGAFLDRTRELIHPRERRERLAANRQCSLRGDCLEQTLTEALHEREAPPK
jgi:hypothetical protein